MTDPIDPQQSPTMAILDQMTKGIAHDLHDGPVQWIIGAKMLCESLHTKAVEGEAISPDQLAPILMALQRAIAESRQIMRGLDAGVVQNGQWLEALREDLTLARTALNSETTPETVFDIDAATKVLPEQLAQTLYRILREAIWNALRHSHGTRITCRTRCDAGWLHAEVADNGVGIIAPAANNEDHWGLRSIQYRAAEAGGSAILTSGSTCPGEPQPTNQGTRWEISLPLKPPATQ